MHHACYSELQLENRCTMVAGNFLETVPTGADLYVLKQVLHTWNDEQAIRILQRCREAMRSDSRLLIAEMFPNPPSTNIPEGGYDPFVGFQSLQMLVLFGGRERSEEQFRQLLYRTDLQCTETLRTPSPFRLFVCQPLRTRTRTEEIWLWSTRYIVHRFTTTQFPGDDHLLATWKMRCRMI